GFGVVRSGATTAGQTNTFTYTAPAGTLVAFDSLTNTSPTTVELLDPTSQQIFNIQGGADAGPYLLPRSGTYTMNVVGNGTGDYKLRLLDLSSNSTALTIG